MYNYSCFSRSHHLPSSPILPSPPGTLPHLSFALTFLEVYFPLLLFPLISLPKKPFCICNALNLSII